MESLSMQKEPPQLPFSAHKKQVEKRMALVGEVGGGGGGGGSWRKMIDRDIYVMYKLGFCTSYNLYKILYKL